MPAAEFNAWGLYYRVFPFGDTRGDLQSGVVASTIANVNRSRGTRPYNPTDFMPQFGQPSSTNDDVIEKRINKFMRRYH